MQNKTVLITGSTDGIGKQTALEMAQLDASLILHGRDPVKGQRVMQEIKEASHNDRLDIFTANLASLKQVRKLSDEIHGKYDRLEVLINNAGVALGSYEVSEDGFEMTFAVNHLAGFLLTMLLQDIIKTGAPSRIINVSSMVHSSTLAIENLNQTKPYDGWHAYCQSKLCNILFTYELARRLEGSGVTVNCLHPGVINTKLLQVNFSGGSPVTEGSNKLIYLATAPELENVTGKYFVNNKPTRSSEISYDPAVQKKLWEMSKKWSGFE
jgi:NAD(P)-dependent dehydrogenase (short-subunit alcohol dehydrogenase family)